MHKPIFALVVALLALVLADSSSDCALWEKGACVCNEESCDFVEDVGVLSPGEAVMYISTKNTAHRLHRSTVSISSASSSSSPSVTLKVDVSRRFQKVVGFGGAFTDAAAFNYYNVSAKVQSDLLRSYYGKQGISYSLGRVPMASADFSIDTYSYDDSPNDFALVNFSLKHDVESGRLDFIREAIRLSQVTNNINLTLFASPWSAPSWMKTNQKRRGGHIIGYPGAAGEEGKYYSTWANYFVKFLSEMKQQGIDIWGVTVQNEPTQHVWWDSCFFTPELERDFVKTELGPKLKQAFPDVKIIILDDQFRLIDKWAKVILGDKDSAKFVSGIGFHWYMELDLEINLYSYVQQARNDYPDILLLATETCEGFYPIVGGPKIGDWTRANRYMHDIVQDMLHGANGYTDWNLYLDMQGGPNHAKNFVDAAIIVDGKNNRFFKNPIYYALGHISKFVLPDYTRVEITGDSFTESVAFLSKDEKSIVVIVLNQHGNKQQDADIHTPAGVVHVHIPAESIITLVIPI